MVKLTGTKQYSYSSTRKLKFYLMWQGAQTNVCISTSLASRCGHVIKCWPTRWKSCWVSLLERLHKTRLSIWWGFFLFPASSCFLLKWRFKDWSFQLLSWIWDNFDDKSHKSGKWKERQKGTWALLTVVLPYQTWHTNLHTSFIFEKNNFHPIEATIISNLCY